jgi:hypothetical protein
VPETIRKHDSIPKKNTSSARTANDTSVFSAGSNRGVDDDRNSGSTTLLFLSFSLDKKGILPTGTDRRHTCGCVLVFLDKKGFFSEAFLRPDDYTLQYV